MDRSDVKKFSLILEGGWLFCHKNQSCSKLVEMDRSGVQKILSHAEGGRGAFLPQKPRLLKNFPEMDRSDVKKFSLILGGVGFSATKTKVAQNCLKWIDLVFQKFPLILSGGGFSATKTKVAQNCLKWIDLMLKNFPSSWVGVAFLPQKPKLLKIAWNG